MQKKYRLKNGFLCALLRAALLTGISFASVFALSFESIPDSVAIREGRSAAGTESFLVNYRLDPTCDGGTACLGAEASIVGIPVKRVSVDVYDDSFRLCPGGQTFGIKMNTKGVVVIGTGEVETSSGKKTPAADAGLRSGDIIYSADDKEIKDINDFTALISSSDREVGLKVGRGGDTLTLKLKPVKSADDGFYRAGIWLRDSTAGIGTVTYINTDDMTFGGLGHGVCDSETGTLLPLGNGTVFPVTVSGIVKGESGSPGELKGYFGAGKSGVITSNTPTGVYGILAAGTESFADGIPIALESEIKNGDAYIRCTLDDGVTREYGVKIEKNSSQGAEKNMTLKVTDETLLEKTGGIVQGMSGSPIIQNGRLIGAVTHVLINDPTTGYGIYIENMLRSAS